MATDSKEKKNRFALLSALNQKIRLRISTKISLVFGAIFLVLGVLAILTVVIASDLSIRAETRDRLERGAYAIARAVQNDDSLMLQVFEEEGYSATVESADRRIVVGDGCLTAEQDFELRGGSLAATRVIRGMRISLSYDMTLDYNAAMAPKIGVAVCILLSLAAMFLVGQLIAGMVTRPINRMTETTRLITKDAMDTRLDAESTQDELRELAEVINNMLDNLQVTLESQERFVSDASHEMRTPIAVIKGYANMLGRWGAQDPAILAESIDAIGKEADNMQRLVDNLLFLSRTDREVQSIEFQPFALSELVDESLRDAEVSDPDHIYVRGRTEVTDAAGARDMLKQLLRIVLDNAKKYTPQGGTITVECYTEGNNAVFAVQDQGIGISKKDLDHIFERFYRADKARNREKGSGLGMSIAKKIADVHHGEIILESKVNEGTRVLVYLPKEQGEEI